MVPLAAPERYFDGKVGFYSFLGPLDRENGKKLRKKQRNLFFKQLPWSVMGIFRPKKCSKRPNMVLLVPPVRYFDGQVGFYRFLSLLDRTKWEKLRKK